MKFSSSYFGRKLNGIKKRLQCLPYGIFYLRNADFTIPRKILLGSRYREVRFLDPRIGNFIYEFNEICLEDCYYLKGLKKKLPEINVIVDIGANQGLFGIAARRHFPNASIHCYEPNLQLTDYLQHNAEAFEAKIYFEAVTKENCKVLLDFGKSDLHTTSRRSPEGNVVGTALAKLIKRAGGEIDILKMDCEGAEWDLLEDKESWKRVKSVTMEYHLWTRPNSTFEQLHEILINLGFLIIRHVPLSSQFGLVTAIKNLV